jgi:hypothetical protein
MATLRGTVANDCTWLMENETGVRYTSGGGGVVFVRNDNLYWQKLNPRRRSRGGDPHLIERGIPPYRPRPSGHCVMHFPELRLKA